MAEEEKKGDKKEEETEKKEEKKEKGAEEKSGEPPRRLLRGDYSVQVHIIEARDLKSRDFGGTSDPTCEVSVMEKKKNTSVHKNTLNVIFDETLTYEFKNLEPEELNQGKIRIEVFDANVIARNVLIGSFELDLVWIYYKDHHEIFRQWVALTDVTDANEGVQGYLQISVQILGPNDELFVHDPSEELDTEAGLLNVLMPPQVESKPYLLRIHVYELDKLPPTDLNGKSDPFVKAVFAGVDNQTTVFKKCLDAKVHETITVPVQEPVLGDRIMIHVNDWDATSKDDVIGTFGFSYKKVKKEKLACCWVHMYGAPPKKEGKIADKMNKAIIEGVWYRGSMMLAMDVNEEKEPKKDKYPAMWNKSLAPALTKWALQVDIYQAVETKNQEGKYKIEMHIRDLVVSTDWKTCERGMCEWYEILRTPNMAPNNDETMEITMPSDIMQCPDIIFYIVKKAGALQTNDVYVSYRRFSWADLVKKQFLAGPEWYEFKQSEILYKLQEDEFPGTVLMGIRAGTFDDKPSVLSPLARPFLSVQNTREDDLFSQVEQSASELTVNIEESINDSINAPLLTGISEPLSARSRGNGVSITPLSKHGDAQTMGELTVTIVSASNVPAFDRDGTSDPYVEITLNGVSKKTEPQKETLSPVWNASFVYSGVSIHDALAIRLKDWNRLSDKLIGEKDNILLSGIMHEAKKDFGQDFNHTKKFPVSDKFPDCVVTLSFNFRFDAKQAHKRKVENKQFSLFGPNSAKDSFKTNDVRLMGRPFPKTYRMLVHVYCARDLEAKDDNGFSDPYFVLSYCGKTAKTEIIPSTLNPQWMQTLLLNVDVPQPAEFAPRLRCAIYDYDKVSGDDLIGRCFVTFTDVIDMMKKRKPRWYTLEDHAGNIQIGRVYIAVEFVDLNKKGQKQIFDMDPNDFQPYYLHMLTIGVRGLKAPLGVFKPQIIYSAPLGGSNEEIGTDPSSDPSANNANFLVVQKIPVKIRTDYELAPVINVVARDNLFGGLIKKSIASAALGVNKFMKKIENSPTNAWTIQTTNVQVLNEKELAAELESEAIVEKRIYSVEKRVVLLAVRKVIELAATRCEDRNFDEKELTAIGKIEEQAVEIYNKEQIKEIEEEIEALNEANKNKEENTATSPRGDNNNTNDSKNKKSNDDQEKEEVPSESEQKDEKKKPIEEEKKQEEEEKKHSSDNDEKKTEQSSLKKEKAADDLDDDPEDDEKKQNDDEKKEQEEEKKKEEEKKETSKEKKKREKAEKKENEKKLKDWDKQDEDLCCDIDSRVPYNPEDFEPDYLKGRPRIKNELEDEMPLEPFESLDLYTGQAGGIKLFGGERRKMGKVKGLWKLSSDAQNPFGNGLKALVQTRTISCRAYILRGIQLISTDRDNSSDPYLVVKLGKESKSTRDRYKKNTLNPYFHEAFEFHTKLPGPSQLTIEVWDWDGIGDDLVGITEIDIENRWFSKEWRRLKKKPLEERTLHNPRSSAPYGKLSLWIDLLTKDEGRNDVMIDISLPPPQSFQFRCIIWKAQDVPIKDELTDQNDLRVTCEFILKEKQKQETDIHWRAKSGKGSWNWRLIFPFELNGIFEKKSSFKISLWDQDVFSASDSIGESMMSFDMIIRKLWLHRLTKPRLILRKDATKRFWLDMRHSEFEGPQGKVQVSMELLNSEEAGKFPAGTGRSDPNMNPFLPPPEGRLLWTLNPFTMLRQLLGDKLCAKICAIICCLGCLAILIFFGPQLFITFMTNLALKVVS